MFYFRIEEFCSVLCIFGKIFCCMTSIDLYIIPALFLHPIIPKIMQADLKPNRKKLNNDHDVYMSIYRNCVIN